MNTSESTVNLIKALIAFQASVGKIKKGSNNPYFKSKYASLNDILDIITEPLNAAGLSIVQFPEGTNTLTTRLMHITGEWMEGNYFMQPTKLDPQSFGSVITYQRRYALGSILSLNIDEDDDGNKASEPAKQVKKPVLTPKSEVWIKSVEYCASNGPDAILKKYDISDSDYTTLIVQAQQLNLQIQKQKES
jgi:hypothetical protein